MCWHCIDWWPLSQAGKALLKIDESDPVWIHGQFSNELVALCASVLNDYPAQYIVAVRGYLEANNPEYKDIIARMVPYDQYSDYRMDQSHWDTESVLRSYYMGEAPHSNGPCLEDVNISLWTPEHASVGPALKRGRIPIKANCPVQVDQLYYQKMGLP